MPQSRRLMSGERLSAFGGEAVEPAPAQLLPEFRSSATARNLQASANGHLLSVRTVIPRRGGRVWYEDQREAHRQIYAGDDVVEYAFMDTDPNSPDNRWLRDATQNQVPVIYFLGSSPGRYQPIIPTFIVGAKAREPRRFLLHFAGPLRVPKAPGQTGWGTRISNLDWRKSNNSGASPARRHAASTSSR